MNAYVKVGPLLQLPGSQLKKRPTLGTPQITAPPPRGARGGDSLPSMKLPISGAVTLAKPSRLPPGQRSSATTRKSVTPSNVAGGPELVRPPPLSPKQTVPPIALAQTNNPLASKPHV